jgi:hypothetical protein
MLISDRPDERALDGIDASGSARSAPSNRDSGRQDLAADFSLVLGGPLYQFFLRSGLTRPPLELVHRRILAFVLITWVPLTILTALAGTSLGGVSIPFLFDLDVHVKFLVCLPLLVMAELVVHRRVRSLVAQFLERNLIIPEERQRFEAIIARAMRLRNSVAIELLLLAFAFTGGYWVWRSHALLGLATWYASPADVSMVFTWAGYWYVFVSLPVARFIMLRWYFRLVIWFLFLWRASRLQLRLNPLHPDRAGGLGFLGGSLDALTPVFFAQTAFLSGLIANQIWHQGASLPEFKLEIGGFLAIFLLLALLPLTIFFPHMAAARRRGLREAGRLAARYVDDFRDKWTQQGISESPLGSPDIQSLADLGNAYSVVYEMRLLPFSRKAVIRLAVLIGLPFLPLTLTMVPFEQILSQLIKLLI